jgi:hypothetical protein
MDAPPTTAQPSAKALWLVWLAAIALFVGSFAFVSYLVASGRLAHRATVFRQTARGWQAAPPPASFAADIQVTDAGVVWVRTLEGLSRLDGASWHSYAAADFGSRLVLPHHPFALDGGDVWVALSGEVVHFDGRQWRCYPHALPTRQPDSIAAVNGQVWVIDAAGNLSHFADGVWTASKLELPGVHWSTTVAPESILELIIESTKRVAAHRRAGLNPSPELATTANGALWLVYQGLWRYDGDSWARVPDVSADARLLGATQPGTYPKQGKQTATRGGIWVLDGDQVSGFNVDGAHPVQYTNRQLGLLDSAWVYAVAGRTPLFVVASSQGLVWFDGSQWRGGQLKQLGFVSAASVAVAPDGTLWGVGYASDSRLSYLSLAVLIPFILAAIYTTWWSSRRRHHQRQATREAVLHATGTVPEELQTPEPSPAKSAAAIGIGIFLSVAAYWLLRRHWPNAPLWLLPAFFVAIHIISTVMSGLKKRKPLASDPIGPGGPGRYDWATSSTAILGGLAVLVLLYGNNIARFFHIRWLRAIPGIGLLIGGKLLFSGYDMFRAYLVERDIKRCRYRDALQTLDGPLGWPATGLWKLMRAEALFYSGSNREAEMVLRGLIETEHSAAHKPLAFEHLGQVLMAQGRFDDARRAFEAAVQLTPSRSAAPAGLAEVRLRQGVETAQALADAERALLLYTSSLAERKGARERAAVIRGNQAWALARLGRSAEALQAIEAGVREMSKTYTPEVAGFHWRAGMAMLAIENTSTAIAHFRRAAELDPDGYYGKLAGKYLSQHSVWGGVGIGGVRS